MTKKRKAAANAAALEANNNEDNDYASKEYWEKRYKNKDSENFEWYYTYETLSPLILQSLRETSNTKEVSVLEVGCGDRPILTDLARENEYTANVVAIDFSEIVIENLKKTDTRDRCQYSVMDARKMSFENNSFDFILDKGTIDAMLCEKKVEQGYINVRSIISECVRSLRGSGSIMIISHMEVDSEQFQDVLDGCILPVLMEASVLLQWHIDAHVPGEDGEGERSSASIYIITSQPRRYITRSFVNCDTTSMRNSVEIPLKVMEY